MLCGHEWCACAVSVEGFKDLEASLANLFSKEGEVMTEGNEIDCDECKQRVIVRRSLAPSYLPPMLWLNLKRFNYGMSNGQYQRVTCPILLQYTRTRTLSVTLSHTLTLNRSLLVSASHISTE